MPVPQDVSIRLMSAADVQAGLHLCRAARWNQTKTDWEFFLTFAPGNALVAEEKGVVIGTVATVPYGPFTWISMVLVDPRARGRGVGRLLLGRGLALVPGNITARLDATPAGEPLYRTVGFDAEYGLARWFVDRPIARPHTAAALQAAHVRPVIAGDWPRILGLDLHAFGASREALLRRMAAEAPEYAWVVAIEGRIRAYMFGRHGHVREHIGPLVADTIDSAHVLLNACLTAHPDRTFFIDAPDREDGWAGVLREHGFAIERPFLRMCRGAATVESDRAVVFAVTGPEFG